MAAIPRTCRPTVSKQRQPRRAPTPEALKARAFAKAYVELVEALQREGVPLENAREEARMAALVWLQDADEAVAVYDPARGPCPTCGNG